MTKWTEDITSSGVLDKSLFDAHTILQATSDNTPVALTLTEQTLAGRLTGENITAIAIGIADNNIPQVDGTSNAPANLDYAKWTASGLEGKTYQELVNDISGVIKATDVEVSELSTATYDDVQDYVNFFGDRTLLSGGGITDNGNGTATVAAGTAWAKATDSDTALGKFFDFSADNSVALTDLVTNYVYLDYNAGTPQIVVTTTSIITHGFKQDHIHIATIFRNGTTLHFHEEDAIGIGRVNIVDSRLLEMHDADRASGLITTDATSLALNVSAGVVYEGLNRHTTAAQIPASWSTWYTTDSGSTWTEVTGQSTIDNAQYNDITSGLSNLTSNRYAVHWLYVDIDGANLFIIYGQDDYTINGAEEAGVPAYLPDIAVHYGVLIAKIIVQESQTSLEILYPWTTTFHSSKATDHGNLAGLGDDDHAQYILHSLADASGDFLVASGNNTFAKQTLAQTLATLSPLTTRGDIMVRDATVSTRLAKGAENTVLVMGANDPAWSATLAGLTLTSPAINGTVTTTGLTLPAFTLGGTVTAGANDITGVGTLKTAFLTLTSDQLEEHGTNADSGTVALNFNGYNGGTTRFRDVDIYNGKQTRYGLFDGSASRFTVDNFGATTLQGKLTAGAVEIEGSAFDINGGTIDGVTITSPNLNEAVALTATASELNLLDLAGLTAGELLVATGAASAAWQSSGVVLSAPDISGSVSAASALTMPTFAMGGAAITGHAQAIADNSILTVDHVTPIATDYVRFTANGLEGREKSEVLGDLNVADGADVTGSNAPQAHKASHQNGGGDEISVTGLSGLLADDQHVLDAEVVAAAIAITTLTTRGDIIYRNATVPARLAKGTAGHVLTMGADDPAWAAAAGGVPDAHKDSHDPNDGSDALDSANAAEISVVVGAGTGVSHSFARADHIHAINHGIANNHIVTIDHATPVDNDYAKFTASGLEGRSIAEALADLSPLSTRGDIMFRNATVSTRLAKGSSGDVLTMGASDPAWSAPAGGGATVATGSYAGNDADARQIAVGFKCSAVIVIGVGDRRITMIPNASIYDIAGAHNSNCVARQYIHATDGFVVSDVTEPMNNTGGTYYYWAISE